MKPSNNASRRSCSRRSLANVAISRNERSLNATHGSHSDWVGKIGLRTEVRPPRRVWPKSGRGAGMARVGSHSILGPLVAGVVFAVASVALARDLHSFRRQIGAVEVNPSMGRPTGRVLAFLGQRLFYDVRLSRSGRTACASCHDPGFGFALPSHCVRRWTGGEAQCACSRRFRLASHADVGWPVSLA